MLLTVILGLWFLTAAILAWALLPDVNNRLIRKRLLSEVVPAARQTLLDRLVRMLTPLHRAMPLTLYKTRMTPLLEAAGVRISPHHLLVLQEMGALTGLIVYAVTIGTNRLDIMWLALLVAGGTVVPPLWMKNRIKARRFAITRDLPEVADLLNLCVSAGSDFMAGLGRVTREFRPCPVRDELGIVLQEIRVGKRRQDAWRAFANRIKTPEASTFARTLIQADRMGTGLTEALKILSEDMRLTRYHWAERYAQQAPLKMLIPLIMSLMAALIIVAGPILLQFLQGGFGLPETASVERPSGERPTAPPKTAPWK